MFSYMQEFQRPGVHLLENEVFPDFITWFKTMSQRFIPGCFQFVANISLSLGSYVFDKVDHVRKIY